MFGKHGLAWSVWRRRAVAAAMVLGIAACGGGGGSGGDSGTGLRVQNISATSTNQTVFAAQQGVRSVTITADVVGDLTRLNGQTVYVIVEDPDGLFQPTPRVYLMADGKGNRIELDGASLLGREGTYRNPLRVNVCLDARCTRPFDGSPFQVPMQVTVLPGPSFPGATPRVIDLPFGSPVTEVTVPLSLPAEANGWQALLQPPPGQTGVSFTMDRLPTEAPQVRLTIPRLLPGRYEGTIQVDVTALLEGQSYSLPAALPVVVNVQPAPAGVLGSWSPENVVLEAFSSGAGSPDGVAFAYLLAVDGPVYTEVSRVVYLPASAAGNLDAGGLAWMNVGVGVGSYGAQTLFSPETSGCVQQPGGGLGCLSPGRYDALLYVRKPGGAELPLPLRVSVNVRPG